MRKSIILLFCMLLTSCAIKARVLPDGYFLKDAKVSQPYEDVIIVGWAISNSVNVKITPADSGLSWAPSDYEEPVLPVTAKDYGRIRILGTPTGTGEIKVTIAGAIHGTMLQSGSEFKKTYTIKVGS